MSIATTLGHFITQPLSAVADVPATFEQLLQRSVLRLLDANMLIEDSLQPLAPERASSVQQPLEQFEQTWVIDQLIDCIKQEGLAPHFHSMIGLFGSIMMSLTATPSQLQQVQDWVNDGIFGHFLMTDKGGPSLAHWRTQLYQADHELRLKVDKMHGIEAHKLGFAMIVAAQPGKPFPVTVMLPPELCAQLNQRAVGNTYLDGHLQLGNCSGEVAVTTDMMLSGGGLGSVNRFLTLVRPRFVKSLMHHLLFLHQHKEVHLDHQDQHHIEYLIGVCQRQLENNHFSIHSVNRVLATKFASNELLLNLVMDNKVVRTEVQRDLLGFSKMEGSSYRCFFEIYSKLKGQRL
ncbi:hypothetical protein CHH28_02860 [Bacterioplanes sanyensis]|uniref:Uncharacterized protein n=1 Tax=Bacterioplanes sanyensis TaxID=1249553 RepID=A0A222FHF8_9GAMM|nr:hypothetical protein [Bacterioplanes sanyensis]ASP37673.1 hypothetical protein CHH28_02860 [Bacterioplanes sanyensis]